MPAFSAICRRGDVSAWRTIFTPAASSPSRLRFLPPLSAFIARIRSAPIAIQTVPTSLGGISLPSSSKIFTSEMGHGLPTVPGFCTHSSGVTSVPPPSVAA